MDVSGNGDTAANEIDDSFYSDDEDWIDGPEDKNLEEVGTQSKMSWKVIEPTLQNTKLHLAKADFIAWEQAKTEIRGLEKSLCEITKKKTINEVSELDVMNIFFGNGSKVGHALQNCLGVADHKEMCKFMDVWSTQAILRGNVKRSEKILDHFENGLSEKILPVDTKTYLQMWKSISTNGGAAIGNDVNILRNSDNSWEELECAFNVTLRKIFVNHRTGEISLVVDDDKDWVKNVGLNALNKYGIKLHVFVRDNERGIVHHTTVTTALMLPLNIQTERNDDSSEICLRRGINEVFGNPNTSVITVDGKTTLSADRGYMSDNVVKETLKDGGNISGTCKRSAWFPFVYEQFLKPNDKRTLLEVHGSPCLFLKEAKINNKIVSAAAFRNGTDSISCTVSSRHHGHHWDGIPLNSREMPTRDEYFTRMEIKGTEKTHEQESTIIDYLLIGLNVESTLQGTADWHLRRKFSLTSSQSDAVIRAIFSYVWTAKIISEAHLKKIATIIYGEDWQSRSRLLKEHEKDGVSILDPKDELREFKSHFEMSIRDSEEDKQAIEFIKPYVLNDNTEETQIQATHKVESLERKVFKAVIEFITSRVEESKRGRFTKQDLILFLMHKNDVRKWMCYKKDCLVATASFFEIRSAKTLSQINLAKSMAANEHHGNLTTNPSADAAKQKAVQAVLVNSFQERFTGARKSSALTGHKCEPLLIANLVTEIKEKSIIIPGVKDVVSVYTTGLVSMASDEAIKDSIDFIIIVQMETGEYECWGGEVKTRTEGSTANSEETFHRRNRNVTGKFSESEDKDMYKNVAKTDERFQLLHHAYVYGFENVLHVVGDKNANVIHCLKVSFSQETQRSYGEILRYAKKYGLEWAYDNSITEVPSYVLNISKNIRTIGDKNALLSTFYLWKHVHTNFNRRPLPPLRRILPLQHSCWNLDKPGSDTATALADSIFFEHPSCNLNTRASNRIIQITFVAIHRLLHVRRMIQHYENYHSVRQYRHEASRRHAFIDTIMKCRLQLFVPGGQALHVRDAPQPTPARRHTRTADLQPSCVPPSTGLTPISTDKRKRKKLLDDSNDNAFKRRSDSCPGIMKRIMCDPSKRGRCALEECGQKTYWFCIGCKQFFCNDLITPDQCEKRGWQKKIIKHPIDWGPKKGETRDLLFYESCTDIHHANSHSSWAEQVKKNIFQEE